VKHFEDLWEEAEKLSVISSSTMEEIISNLQKDIENLSSNEDKNYIIGRMLFNITRISYKYNINVYSSLIEAMNDFRFSLLEQEENE